MTATQPYALNNIFTSLPRHGRIPHLRREHVHHLSLVIKRLINKKLSDVDRKFTLSRFKRMMVGVPDGVMEDLEDKRDQVPTNEDIEIDLLKLKGDFLKRKVAYLVRKQLPEWKDVAVKDIELERVSGALTNAVFFVTAPPKRVTILQSPSPSSPMSISNSIGSDTSGADSAGSPPSLEEVIDDIPRKVLLRVYGVGVDQLFQREKELYWLKMLSQLNIGAQLLGIFKNGRLEQYLDSTTLTKQDMRRPETSRAIAARLYELHNIVKTFPPQPEDLAQLEVWTNIDKWYPLAVKTVTATYKDMPDRRETLRKFGLEKLKKEIEDLKDILSMVDSPIVFAHNDAQYGNILRLTDTGELVLVDFEYAGYNPRGFDIGNHFCEWTADYHSDEPHKLHFEQYPSREEQEVFFNAYLDMEVELSGNIRKEASTTKRMNGHSSSTERRAVLDKLYIECALWGMTSHIMWGLWGLIQASQSEIEFDYFRYALQRLQAFRRRRDEWSEYVQQLRTERNKRRSLQASENSSEDDLVDHVDKKRKEGS